MSRVGLTELIEKCKEQEFVEWYLQKYGLFSYDNLVQSIPNLNKLIKEFNGEER